MTKAVIFYCVFVFYSVIVIGGVTAQKDFVTTYKKCCQSGENKAKEGGQCGGFTGALPGVPVEQQAICLSAMDRCCSKQKRESNCVVGITKARDSKPCGGTRDPGSDVIKDCCEACGLGLMTGASGSGCDPTWFELRPPADGAFRQCCENIPTEPPTTTTTTTTTTKTIPVPATTPKNISLIPPPPPIDDVCQLFPGELCEHICIAVPGSYYCECRPGYALQPDKNTCKLSAETPNGPGNRCDDNNPCEQQCIDTGTAIKCACSKGYELAKDQTSCNDVNECLTGVANCDYYTEICQNTPGSFQCDLKPTTQIDFPSNDLSCPPGYFFSPYNQKCEDVDECAQGLHDCNLESQDCLNTVGNFTCHNKVSKNTCPAGFKRNMVLGGCEDFDECKDGTNPCAANEICNNYSGGYQCDPVPTNLPLERPFPSSPDANNYLYDPYTEPTSDYTPNSKPNSRYPDYYKPTHPNDYQNKPYTSKLITTTPTNDPRNPDYYKPTPRPENKVNYNPQPTDYQIRPYTPVRTTTPTNDPRNPVYYKPTPRNDDKLNYNPDTTPEPTPDYRNPAPRNNYRPKYDTNSTSTTTPTNDPSNPEYYRPTPRNYYDANGYETTPPKASTFRLSQSQNESPTSTPNRYRPTAVTPKEDSTEESSDRRCDQGFQTDSLGQCIDINECYQGTHHCDSNQDCVNTIGSFECRCKIGFELNSLTNACVDVNECQIKQDRCDRSSQRCDNTIGSYRCTRVQGCGTGYTLNDANNVCEDDDECLLNTHNCHGLGPNFECKNTVGSFRCVRKSNRRQHNFSSRYPGYSTNPVPFVPRYSTPSETTTPNRINPSLKTCFEGFRLNSWGQCEDINECAEKKMCKSNEKCVNFDGGYRCEAPQCPSGKKLNDEGTRCIDIDECATGTHKCGPNEKCINKDGGYLCQCEPGYMLVGDHCEDLDECERFKGRTCAPNSICENTIGSFRCKCKHGYRSISDTSCEDVNECQEQPGLCEQTCINTRGSYRCACKQGFVLSYDNRTCEDRDECTEFKNDKLCVGQCVNTPGSYVCSCPPGYKLSTNGRTCNDVDECESSTTCRPNQICLNMRGSYRCQELVCPPGFSKHPEYQHRCKRDESSPPCYNKAYCQNPTEADTISFNYITIPSMLPIPEAGFNDLFRMRGPRWTNFSVNFNITLESVVPQTSRYINIADLSFFEMRQNTYHEAVIGMIRPIEGPQDIEISIKMIIFYNNNIQSVAIAKLYIFVSEYTF